MDRRLETRRSADRRGEQSDARLENRIALALMVLVFLATLAMVQWQNHGAAWYEPGSGYHCISYRSDVVLCVGNGVKG